MRVGAVGLGRMGGPMTDRVIAAGHDVRAVDLAAPAVAARVAAGGQAASTPAEAARDADVILVVVVDDQQVRDVVTGPDGVLAGAPEGAVICVHCTVEPATLDEIASAAAVRGVAVIDAGVSGGEPGARAGTLITMVGGAEEAVGRAGPVLHCFSREVVHAGPLGAGMSLKLARNAVGYVMMAAAHEAMALSAAAGVDLGQLEHVLRETDLPGMYFAPFRLGGPAPLAPDDPPELHDWLRHTYALAVKDLDQARALAARLGVNVPAFDVTRAGFARVVRLQEEP